MTQKKDNNSTLILLALALMAVLLENCDSDTVRGLQHIMRAKRAAEIAKRASTVTSSAQVIRRPVIRYRTGTDHLVTHHHLSENSGWGWKENEEKKEPKLDGKDIVASAIGIAILKVGKILVLGALATLVAVLGLIATSGLVVSPWSLPLHAFWIGLLFLIPFCPLFILGFFLVAFKDIVTHIRYEEDEEEEEHHGWGWSGPTGSHHQGWKRRGVIRDQPVWQLHRRMMDVMRTLPDFDAYERTV